jgi:acetolactate synthase I/II/III large subunit
MRMTGGQALARQLEREGVRHVFGIPGVQLDWATDGLNDVAHCIRYVTPRHEQATSYMADGYARTTGRPGVCMVVPGPGLFNALSGLATAYACSSRVLCICGQIRSDLIGKGYGMLHEVKNQTQTLASVTKWNALARRPEEIPELVNEAFRQLLSGRPRPVGLEIPPDVLAATGDVALLPAARPEQIPLDVEAIAEAVRLLQQARTPVIYVGGGGVASRAQANLIELARLLQAPIVMSDNGRGAVSDRHPLTLTNLGGRCVFPHADVVLVVGSRFLNAMGKPPSDRAGQRFIYINIEPADMRPPRPPGLRIEADAATALRALVDAVRAQPRESREHEVALVRGWCDSQMNPVEPQMSYLRVLRECIPDEGVLVSELTQVGYAASFGYPVYVPASYLTPGYQGTLGYGFATALGAAIGKPGRIVVSVTGDGGFGWNLQELATAAKYQLDVVVVVFKDDAFGNVQRIQDALFKRRIGTDLCNPDFAKLAQAFGLQATRADSPDELRSSLAEAIARGGPSLIEVPVSSMPSGWHLIHTHMPPPQPPPPNPLGEPTATDQA